MKKCKWCKIQENIWKNWRFVVVANFIKLRYLHRRAPLDIWFAKTKYYTYSQYHTVNAWILVISKNVKMLWGCPTWRGKSESEAKLTSILERCIPATTRTWAQTSQKSFSSIKYIFILEVFSTNLALLPGEGPNIYWEALIVTSGTSHFTKE